jgi:hypothetical protein
MQQKVNFALVDMFVSTLCAESLVANDEFITLIETLDTCAGVISRRGVSREVQNRFVAHVAHLKSELFDAAIVHINTDMWTSNENEPLGTFFASWINNDWELRAAAVRCDPVPGQHTADAIAAVCADSLLILVLSTRSGLCGRTARAIALRPARLWLRLQDAPRR